MLRERTDDLRRSQVIHPPTPNAAKITIPPAVRKGLLSLEEALCRRRSVREFTDRPLTDEQIGQLLWAAQGITDPQGLRTAPSAGALYALEVYVATANGFYKYIPESHRMERQSVKDLRHALYLAASEQESILGAAAVFVIVAIYSRLAEKYGEERSVRYAHLEAGHAAQNLLLQAAALGLASVPVGAFRDDQVKTALSLPPEQSPLYLIPVGAGSHSTVNDQMNGRRSLQGNGSKGKRARSILSTAKSKSAVSTSRFRIKVRNRGLAN